LLYEHRHLSHLVPQASLGLIIMRIVATVDGRDSPLPAASAVLRGAVVVCPWRDAPGCREG
jgi:hypothetical protein